MSKELDNKIKEQYKIQIAEMLKEGIRPSILIGITKEGNLFTFSPLPQDTIKKIFSTLLMRMEIDKTKEII